ncbi:MAG: hypothetical protein HC822_03825 [Oscillochloris sp.]|nr:hypothetical protein [Oscillochloris sp.]
MNNYLLMRSLKPYQAIQVLNGAAPQVAKQHQHIKVKLFTPPNQPVRVMLSVANPSGELAVKLKEAYTGLVGGVAGLQQVQQVPEGSVDLATGVTNLLTLPNYDEEPAQPARNDYLVISKAEPDRAEKLYGMIAAAATQVAVAAADAANGQWYVYHVIADPDRDEAFTTLVRQRLGAVVLQGYEAGRYQGEPWLMFAPESHIPGRRR